MGVEEWISSSTVDARKKGVGERQEAFSCSSLSSLSVCDRSCPHRDCVAVSCPSLRDRLVDVVAELLDLICPGLIGSWVDSAVKSWLDRAGLPVCRYRPVVSSPAVCGNIDHPAVMSAVTGDARLRANRTLTWRYQEL